MDGNLGVIATRTAQESGYAQAVIRAAEEVLGAHLQNEIDDGLRGNIHKGLHLMEREAGFFPNGEPKVLIHEQISEKRICVIARFTRHGFIQEDCELRLMLRTLASDEARTIKLFLGWFPFQRQDKITMLREPDSCKWYIEQLEASAGGLLSNLVAYELHNSAITNFGQKVRILNVYTTRTIAEFVKRELINELDQLVICATDAGGAERARTLARALNTYHVISSKHHGKGMAAKSEGILGDVVGKTVLIVDDLIATGGSLVTAADRAREAGAKEQVYAVATHPQFAPDIENGITAEEKIKNGGLKVWVGDTVELGQPYLEANRDWLIGQFSTVDCTAHYMVGLMAGLSREELRKFYHSGKPTVK